jgi:hypothetical protein
LLINQKGNYITFENKVLLAINWLN